MKIIDIFKHLFGKKDIRKEGMKKHPLPIFVTLPKARRLRSTRRTF